jgi:enoyl-CoA hydratase/carnithine racemase
MPRGGEYGVIRRQRNKPLIAAVEGYALGGGFEIALACDLIVASATAQFGLPETKRGLVATSGALFRAPRALPINVARELLITGRTLDPDRAKDLGVVNAVTAPGKALDEALVMAAEICESSPTSVSLSLKAIDALYAEADTAGWTITDDAKDAVLRSPDIAEGLDAFASRRTPQWSGLPPT